MERLYAASGPWLLTSKTWPMTVFLLIDNFESMYLGRTEPLGPHSNAVRLILRERGYPQFLDRSSFCLWRMAHGRIQARQILLREEPDPEQIEWLNRLDHGITYLRISSNIHQINTIAAAVTKLIQSEQGIKSTVTKRREEAHKLIHSSQNLLASIEQWIADVGEKWRPKVVAGNCALQESDQDSPSHPSLPDFLCPRMLNYSDIWLAYTWNFHAASQIVLRESLVDTVQFKNDLEMRESSTEDEELIRAQHQGVQRLSSSIIRSFPQLLGFVHGDVQPPHALPQGKMAGRYFSLFSLSIVQRARFTSAEHKQTATEVLNWIKSSHQLT
ncbi:hypothetical protein LTS17_002713 [Exophiala oligosperma]